MPTTLCRKAWVLLADARCGRLLCCGPSTQGRWRLEERARVENIWLGEGRSRILPLYGAARRIPTADGWLAENELKRFAWQVATWLKRRIRRHRIERLMVLASPRVIGALREVQPECPAAQVEEGSAELMRLPLWALSEHPAIRRLVAPGPGDQP